MRSQESEVEAEVEVEVEPESINFMEESKI